MLRVRPARLARLQQAILALLSRGSASRGALTSIVGHAAWAMIMRRECLSIFNGVYRFIQVAGPTPMQLWPSVRQKLSAVAALLPLMWASSRVPWLGALYASDAS
eukprot:2492709-Pyramimonas_sp.AAC.1